MIKLHIPRTNAWSPDGKIIASSGSDGSIKLWDTKTWECLKTLQGHQSWVYAFALAKPDTREASHEGESLLVQTVKYWSVVDLTR